MEEKNKKVLCHLQRLCVRRECCTSDLYAKALKFLEGDEAAAADLLAELKRDGFVDDFRYASAYAREKAEMEGWGRFKITRFLAAKGIDRELVSEALAQTDRAKAERRLEEVLASRYRLWADEPDCRLKLLKFALSRGYDYDEARPVVERLLQG